MIETLKKLQDLSIEEQIRTTIRRCKKTTCVVEEVSWLKMSFQLAMIPSHHHQQQQQQKIPREKKTSTGFTSTKTWWWTLIPNNMQQTLREAQCNNYITLISKLSHNVSKKEKKTRIYLEEPKINNSLRHHSDVATTWTRIISYFQSPIAQLHFSPRTGKIAPFNYHELVTPKKTRPKKPMLSLC